ncbi:hypothetical protein CBM2592_B150009 [Cupriavidus taiwanensis]|nr:hypothetical protein CBM2592_B150009 [Cupriavidus taiwanensis]SOZ71616.1 hypothetical protein CBM2617_B180010 [Cupriavidus taiwanensis]SOZ86864.1 hypothetical protein CBM2618_B200010 [Cupriavidus taiwanensis]SOZ89962.1 hypothetical protein CBM2622_B190010 [Cupriavidus taiwanensis]SOZ94564.1 hypothetical protein CBM2621_B190009 [Cupriavidus taiwanensis]
MQGCHRVGATRRSHRPSASLVGALERTARRATGAAGVREPGTVGAGGGRPGAGFCLMLLSWRAWASFSPIPPGIEVGGQDSEVLVWDGIHREWPPY